MTGWEYRTYLFEPGEPKLDKFNELGAEGWEAFRFEVDYPGSARTRVWFKRPVTT